MASAGPKTLAALEDRLRTLWRQQDLPATIELAQSLRLSHPRAAVGYRIGALALRQFGAIAEADEVLAQAASAFVDPAWLCEERGRLAQQAGNWLEVSTQAELLRRRFPQVQSGWRLGLLSLRRLGRYDEAAALLSGATQWADSPWLLAEIAGLAQARGDANAAMDAWRRVRAADPTRLDGYIGGFKSCLVAKRIDLAEALHRNAMGQFAPAPWLMIQAGELHFAAARFDDAAIAWQALRAAYPDSQEGYHGGYRTYRKLGNLALAEDVLRAALTQFPADRWALMETAYLADARYDYDQVDKSWAHATAMRPDDLQIALKYAMARTLDRNLEARDYPTTLSRLRALNARAPDYAEAWAAHIKILRFNNALADADRMAESCVRRMPDDAELWLEYAATAGPAAHAQTASRLAEATARCPGHQGLQNEFGKSLVRAGRFDEAEQQYRKAVARFPESVDLLCGYADLAMRRQDWPQALLRWQQVRDKFPEERRMASGLVDTQAALDAEGIPMPDLAAPAIHGGKGSESGRREMFASFESLGGTGQGCEFGLVQRAGGAEPLGLLRWAQIGPEDLLAALNSRFHGVGTHGQTLIDYYIGEDPENPEYRYNDTRFNIRMHTFVRKRDLTKAKMDEQTCLRMSFLKRKLIQDLEEADKIFVYKIHERNLDDDELMRLREAMLGFGKNILLYVRYADDDHVSGTVVPMGDGLLIGYISGFNIDPETRKLRPPDLPAWNAICDAAEDWRQNRLP